MAFARISNVMRWCRALPCMGLWLAQPAASETPPRAAAEAAFADAVRAAQVPGKADARAERGMAGPLPVPQDGMHDGRSQDIIVQADLEKARTALAEALAADYATRLLRLTTRPGDRWNQGEFRLCVDLTNTGPLTVRAIHADVQLRGIRLASLVSLASIVVAEDSTADILIPTSSKAGGKLVEGLPPRQTWRQAQDTCLRLNEAGLSTGTGLEALRSIGGFSRQARDWRLVVTAVVLTRPSSDATPSDDDNLASVESHTAVFSEQIRRLEQAALGAGRRASGNGSDANANPIILRVQAALNARGFPVGTPDGVMGPRTVAAIKALQQAEGHPPTGILTDQHLQRLLETAR